MSGDVDPMRVDAAFAKSDVFHRIVADGMWGGALISTLLGTELPGPGTIWVTQSLNFRRPVGLGDVLTVSVTVTQKKDGNRVVLDLSLIHISEPTRRTP